MTEKLCVVCGSAFEARTYAKVCSKNCFRVYRSEYNQQYRAVNIDRIRYRELAYVAAHKEQKQEYMRRYSTINRDRLLKKNREYRTANFERIHEQQKEHRQRPEVRERRRERQKEYRQRPETRERRLEQGRNRYDANRDRIKRAERDRYAVKSAALKVIRDLTDFKDSSHSLTAKRNRKYSVDRVREANRLRARKYRAIHHERILEAERARRVTRQASFQLIRKLETEGLKGLLP